MVLQRELIQWLQSIEISHPVRQPKRDIANGFTVGEICSHYWSNVSINSFSNHVSAGTRESNWFLIRKAFYENGFHLKHISPFMHPSVNMKKTLRAAMSAEERQFDELLDGIMGAQNLSKESPYLKLIPAAEHENPVSCALALLCMLYTHFTKRTLKFEPPPKASVPPLDKMPIFHRSRAACASAAPLPSDAFVTPESQPTVTTLPQRPEIPPESVPEVQKPAKSKVGPAQQVLKDVPKIELSRSAPVTIREEENARRPEQEMQFESVTITALRPEMMAKFGVVGPVTLVEGKKGEDGRIEVKEKNTRVEHQVADFLSDLICELEITDHETVKALSDAVIDNPKAKSTLIKYVITKAKEKELEEPIVKAWWYLSTRIVHIANYLQQFPHQSEELFKLLGDAFPSSDDNYCMEPLLFAISEGLRRNHGNLLALSKGVEKRELWLQQCKEFSDESLECAESENALAPVNASLRTVGGKELVYTSDSLVPLEVLQYAFRKAPIIFFISSLIAYLRICVGSQFAVNLLRWCVLPGLSAAPSVSTCYKAWLCSLFVSLSDVVESGTEGNQDFSTGSFVEVAAVVADQNKDSLSIMSCLVKFLLAEFNYSFYVAEETTVHGFPNIGLNYKAEEFIVTHINRTLLTSVEDEKKEEAISALSAVVSASNKLFQPDSMTAKMCVMQLQGILDNLETISKSQLDFLCSILKNMQKHDLLNSSPAGNYESPTDLTLKVLNGITSKKLSDNNDVDNIKRQIKIISALWEFISVENFQVDTIRVIYACGADFSINIKRLFFNTSRQAESLLTFSLFLKELSQLSKSVKLALLAVDEYPLSKNRIQDIVSKICEGDTELLNTSFGSLVNFLYEILVTSDSYETPSEKLDYWVNLQRIAHGAISEIGFVIESDASAALIRPQDLGELKEICAEWQSLSSTIKPYLICCINTHNLINSRYSQNDASTNLENVKGAVDDAFMKTVRISVILHAFCNSAQNLLIKNNLNTDIVWRDDLKATENAIKWIEEEVS